MNSGCIVLARRHHCSNYTTFQNQLNKEKTRFPETGDCFTKRRSLHEYLKLFSFPSNYTFHLATSTISCLMVSMKYISLLINSSQSQSSNWRYKLVLLFYFLLWLMATATALIFITLHLSRQQYLIRFFLYIHMVFFGQRRFFNLYNFDFLIVLLNHFMQAPLFDCSVVAIRILKKLLSLTHTCAL